MSERDRVVSHRERSAVWAFLAILAATQGGPLLWLAGAAATAAVIHLGAVSVV